MRTVKLGSQGLVVSTEGLGCMGMSTTYGPSNEEENLATLHRALELGITLFDTAEVYGPYLNEQLLVNPLSVASVTILSCQPRSVSGSKTANSSLRTAAPCSTAARNTSRKP